MTDPATIPALSLSDVTFGWPGARGRGGFRLTCPAFAMQPGESVLLLGESGSGKSTLLALICGITAADSGRVAVAGTDLAALRPGQRDRFRAERIGVIFQQFNLLPYASVADNIALPLRFAPGRRAGADAAAALCAALGLPDDVLTTPAGRLSVGQQQRVAAARALIGAPGLIVADEPTSALDAATQGSFLDLLFAQARDAGTALLMVSHDARLGDRFDRIVQLHDIVTTHRSAA